MKRLVGKTVVSSMLIVAISVGLILARSTAFAQAPEPPTSARNTAPLTILQINDVYSTVPVNGMGGLARVATIKGDLAKAGRNPLLMIGGDFLSSSVSSTVFKGAQMIAALNAAGLDYATLGNHEFDFGVDTLLTRMAEARFQWIIANVIDKRTGAPLGGAVPYVIRDLGAMKVGILGLCIDSEGILPSIHERLDIQDPIATVERYLPEMKQRGVNTIVLLTHLYFATDRALATRFPEIDLIVGGHEHYPIVSVSGRTLISKAGMDGRFVARIDLDRKGDAPLDRFYELIPITAAVAEDRSTADVVSGWESRLDAEMSATIGTSGVPLDAGEVRLRTGETNLGNLFADAMRQQVNADAAIINSGGLRGNRVYPAGPITRRMLLEMHPFSNIVCKIEITGAMLLRALNYSVARLPTAWGTFPQVSGMTMRVNAAAPAESRVHDVTVGGAPLDPARTYTLAVSDYLLAGGDGFNMFGESKVLIDAAGGTLVSDAVGQAITAQSTVAPQTDGRITIVR